MQVTAYPFFAFLSIILHRPHGKKTLLPLKCKQNRPRKRGRLKYRIGRISRRQKTMHDRCLRQYAVRIKTGYVTHFTVQRFVRNHFCLRHVCCVRSKRSFCLRHDTQSHVALPNALPQRHLVCQLQPQFFAEAGHIGGGVETAIALHAVHYAVHQLSVPQKILV